MPRFVEFTDASRDVKVLVNVDIVVAVWPRRNGGARLAINAETMRTGYCINVVEGYDAVAKAVASS